jgi:hypothetical protein
MSIFAGAYSLTGTWVRANMFRELLMNNRTIVLALAIGVGSLAIVAPGWGQADASKSNQSPVAPTERPRLTIEVTGGDANKPVENASVYVKTVVEHSVLKDKKTELNVKTNQQGMAHIADGPTGRVLIQIVAEGWKSYGHWYDITDAKQVVKIHLDRPPKWY